MKITLFHDEQKDYYSIARKHTLKDWKIIVTILDKIVRLCHKQLINLYLL